MNKCPITYEDCGDAKYSQEGLKLLSKNLRHLNDFPYSSKEQIQLAAEMMDKLSIQGVQPKLSVKLNVKKEIFEIVQKNGTFIFKPPHQYYDELPQNEDLTMKLAEVVGIPVPLHGMVYNKDGSLSYFIKRFDRLSNDHKISSEDFSQLLESSRDTKYDPSMEKIIPALDKHCSFPKIEKLKLFRLVLFNFLVGNEDAHSKNFSLVRRKGRVELSPAYDLVNSTILYDKPREEIALHLNGKKSNLKRSDLINYFGRERLGLSEKIINNELQNFEKHLLQWQELIERSFLSAKFRNKYLELIHSRWNRLK